MADTDLSSPGDLGGAGTPAPARTWRPRGVIVTATVFTILFAVGMLVGWLGLPPDVRSSFTIFQVGTLFGIIAVLEVVMWLLAGSSVRADADGLTIRNGWRRHTLAWDQVRRVRLRPGDPWATAELFGPDDTAAGAGDDPGVEPEPRTVMLFGIQGSEGTAARKAVRVLNGHLNARHRSD